MTEQIKNRQPLFKRLWIYQSERFPLLAHGILILAFSVSAVCYSALLRGQSGFPPASMLVMAFISAMAFFMMLRIADEFKDYAEDARYRPHRPVPRGLVTLRELGWLGLALAILQMVLALFMNNILILLLLVTWLYLLAMSFEFGIKSWLKAHPFHYMWSHMLIMPLIDLYATAWDWSVLPGIPPGGLYWFLLVSFFNGIVIETGRKIRAPEQEREGVETYTALWGTRKAIGVWWLSIVLTALCAWMAAIKTGFALPVFVLLSILISMAFVLGLMFVKNPGSKLAKSVENFSGLWTILMYTSLGLLPMLWVFFTA